MSNKIELFSGKISTPNLKLAYNKIYWLQTAQDHTFYLQFVSAKYDYRLKLTLRESIRKMGLDNLTDLSIFWKNYFNKITNGMEDLERV